MQKLPIHTTASALEMAEMIFGNDLTIVSASYSGQESASGIYSEGDAVSDAVTPSDRGVILSTGLASTFTNASGAFNQRTNRTAQTDGEDRNPEFDAVAGTSTFDAAYLDVSFTATEARQMTMQFVFASEEHPEFTTSIYQDFVAVSVNGDYVPITVGDGDVDPLNININANENLFVDNVAGMFNTEMDGFTQTMSLKLAIQPGLNTLRIVIADVSDNRFDSALLIAADSVQTQLIANTDEVTLTTGGTRTVDVLANDVNTTGNALTITHISGQPVTVGTTLTLKSGQMVTVQSDGTLTLTGDDDEEKTSFSYTVDDNNGTSDVGFVTINQVPCFTAGTLIRTPDGDVPVEALEVGDLVETMDNGAQPLRWVGHRVVPAEGKLAPIRITAGTFGPHGTLTLSPLHRVLVQHAWAELLFGEEQVLVAARDLVNDHSVRCVSGGTVAYFHLLFDEHQIVFSENLPTESFLPGPQTASCFEAEIVEEIYQLFPEIDRQSGEGYGPMARRGLRGFEAVAMAHMAAE